MNSLKILKEHSVIDGILDDWQSVLGDDLDRYRNHVYRVFNLCLALNQYRQTDETTVAVAACFHDLAIWSKQSMDYLELSVDEMRQYIEAQGWDIDIDTVATMIRYHHKIRPYRGPYERVTESFRKADLCDLSKGRLHFGLGSEAMALLRDTFPYLGFHRQMRWLSFRQFVRHPFRPLPMIKW